MKSRDKLEESEEMCQEERRDVDQVPTNLTGESRLCEKESNPEENLKLQVKKQNYTSNIIIHKIKNGDEVSYIVF